MLVEMVGRFTNLNDSNKREYGTKFYKGWWNLKPGFFENILGNVVEKCVMVGKYLVFNSNSNNFFHQTTLNQQKLRNLESEERKNTYICWNGWMVVPSSKNLPEIS